MEFLNYLIIRASNLRHHLTFHTLGLIAINPSNSLLDVNDTVLVVMRGDEDTFQHQPQIDEAGIENVYPSMELSSDLIT